MNGNLQQSVMIKLHTVIVITFSAITYRISKLKVATVHQSKINEDKN